MKGNKGLNFTTLVSSNGMNSVVLMSPLKVTEKTLPQLTETKAFPTSIFIDKKGNVKKIYIGFNGSGTGEHYKCDTFHLYLHKQQ
ncbi:MAG: redoxin [Segetibacter sp.]|nr:redoxin [Segetibacter sp.]